MNVQRSSLRLLFVGIICLALASRVQAAPVTASYDVVIYGGSAGGVAAAVQARRMGKTAVIIEPGKHLGGLTSGGLGATDIGNKAAIGGISREFYQRVRKHYNDPQSWTHEKPENYRSGRGSEGAVEDTMWTFEPSVAEKILRDWCKEEKVEVIYGKRLDLKAGVQKQGSQIVTIQMESGEVYAGKMFLDASYEGDLLALAGVSFHVGREANSVYGETLNGMEVKLAKSHQMADGVDPYVKKGDKTSGLLPGVHGDSPGDEGAGDKRVQAYNFRMCLTDRKENQIPFTEPEGYDPQRYELLLRNFEAGETRAPWAPVLMPNRKTDVNNNHGFSTDNIGMNYEYPEADYAKRDAIFKDHVRYQQGLLWTLVSNPRVPEKIRNEISRWGLCKDEFTDNGGWPHQMYVREARRMTSEYVMTQNDCEGRRMCNDPVGLGAYNMDSHNVQRYVDSKGQVKNEGDVQVGVSPYPISYKSIVPSQNQCGNLLVPVNLSSSHIAFGSIRMEPVFMVLGQSAATAACLAIDDKVTVQQLDYKKLSERLVADKQVLVWTGPKRTPAATGIELKKFSGIVIDDDKARFVGEWTPSNVLPGFVGERYLHDTNTGKGQKSVTFVIPLPEPGFYEVRLAYTADKNRATNVPVVIETCNLFTVVWVNQRQKPDLEGAFLSLGKYLSARQIVVTVRTDATNGHVIADAVQAVRVPF